MSSKYKTLINGPVNVIRLEAKLNGINKVLYTFMDYHLDVKNQTKCLDVRSKDIQDYLVTNFDEISKSPTIYDFFFEISPTHILNNAYLTKKKYIWEINDLFLQSFMIDTKKNVVGKSNNFPNVRLHYADIRDYLVDHHKVLYELAKFINNVIASQQLYFDDIEKIRSTLHISISTIKIIYDMLYPNKDKKNKDKIKKNKLKPSIPATTEELAKYTSQDFLDNMGNFINKIRDKYKHKDIRDKINKIIDTELHDIFLQTFDHTNKYLNILDILQKQLLVPVGKLRENKYLGTIHYKPLYEDLALLSELSFANEVYHDYEMNIFATMTDIFFLRRFLEKDYVTNGISYTGAMHSINYIYMLVKYFGFKITHYSYINIKDNDLDKLNSNIVNSKTFRDIDIYFSQEYILQCSDMTSFPKLFK